MEGILRGAVGGVGCLEDERDSIALILETKSEALSSSPTSATHLLGNIGYIIDFSEP